MDEELKLMMLKFLQRHFPITKLKKDGSRRFKRGIYISSGFTGKEDKKYYINDNNDLKLLYYELFDILENVFGTNANNINPVILKHLGLS